MKSSRRIFSAFFAGMFIFAIAQVSASAQTAVAPVANPCPRLAPGSVLHNPPSLFSQKGVLVVSFSYQTTTDADGRTLFCFMTPDGKQNPTLHVRPGDHLIVNVTNNVPASGGMSMAMSAADQCGDSVMTATSMNIHYHGTNTAPICHQDEVIHTIINSGQSFQYNLAFPSDEPPGLYWYHPHIHGIAEPAVLGGASGAIVVEGLENLQPSVAGLRQRIMVLRDQIVAGGLAPGGDVPSWDLTLNNIPIAYPALTPTIIRMQSGEKELWRFSNSAADSLVDLQVLFDGVPQTLQIVGLDGVPTGSQDGTRQGKIVPAKHILIPTAGRAEFIVPAVPSSVKKAVFMTNSVVTGPTGDNDTQRTLATLQVVGGAGNNVNNDADGRAPAVNAAPGVQRFEGLRTAAVNTKRKLYFSEVISDPSDPLSPTNFFITVEGATPTMFDPANPPAVVATQGTVEDWTIENRATENHEFHFHQIHFLVLSQNNFELNGTQQAENIKGQFLDMIQIPYWDGNPAHPYPSVKVRMDFRGPDIGDFVYHCHILGHEDNGMMAVIRVLPAANSKQSTPTPKATASIQTNGSTSAPVVTPAYATETIDRTFMPSWTELDMLK
ncbi:MAG TPA: multicopper oxidase domain-containing protein [Candidatus Angelobacter sp.]|jgi:FtsP/CotA-like multicopper oxidase with cupredoxin domain|nr:multicopper oxidase domain-containing protein [Candidatus Angelobacter sp.]